MSSRNTPKDNTSHHLKPNTFPLSSPPALLNTLSDHIAIIDTKGTICHINDAWTVFAQANGASPRAVGVGVNYLDICRKAISLEKLESSLEALHGIEQVLDHKRSVFELEYPCHAPETRRWFRMRCSLIEGTEHALICHTDITQEKRLRQQLEAQEEEFKSLQSIQKEVASIIELEPVIAKILDQIHRIIQPDLAMLFLQEGENLVLQKVIPSIPDSFSLSNRQHTIGECLCGLSVKLQKSVYSLDIITDDRCSRDECKMAGFRSFASLPLIHDNSVLGCIGIASLQTRDFSANSKFLETAAIDIALSLHNALLYNQLQRYADDIRHQLNEHQRLEQVTLTKKKLEAIGHLAGGIAHDFNNILAAIMGYSELSLRKVTDPDTIDYLKGVLKACNRAKDLIQQILTFSRKNDANLTPVDLRSIVDETMSLIRRSLPGNITLQERLEIVGTATIRGNPLHLQQIFMNICNNSLQAMQESGGMLVVKLHMQIADESLLQHCPELETGRSYIVLSIRDTGYGIDANHLDSIFEPYFTTKVPEKGTGLGLAVVHGVVKHHNGAILVESILRHGTTISLFFPLLESEEVTVPPKKHLPSPGDPPHILIVDDEAPILQILSRILENNGYKTTASQFPREAMTLFRKSPQRYDLILCDLTMPELTGDLLAKEIKKIRWNIPIILCTGHSVNQLKDVDTSNIDKILQKPLSQAELSTAVRDALQQINLHH